jgi:hypothetical protein
LDGNEESLFDWLYPTRQGEMKAISPQEEDENNSVQSGV